jgi:hypothetical protein
MNQAPQMNTLFSFERPLRQLTAVAFAIAAILHSSQVFAEKGTATAGATVLAAPVVVTKTADLSFGKFATGAAGSITISTSGVRTVSGGVLPSADGGAMTAATFVVSGDRGAAYSITHGGTSALSRTSGSETMSMTKFSDVSAGNATTGTVAGGTLNAGTQSIYVGGTLAVGANQAGGAYTGTVSVTVEYN